MTLHRRESRFRPHTFAALAIGLAAPFQLRWGGIIYGSEILLAIAALWALITRPDDARFWRPPFTTLVGFLGVTLLAYVVADLVRETEPPNLVRGWARTIVIGSNFVGLYFLCRRNPLNLLMYASAGAASMLGFLAWNGRLLEDWKFGAATPVTLLIACLVPTMTRRGVLWGSLTLGAVGLVHLTFDSREIGGNCLLAGALLIARCCCGRQWKPRFRVAVGALAAAGVLLYVNLLSREGYSQRHHFSNAWRSASLATAMTAISGSPWVGNGSQANNFELQSRYDSIFAAQAGVRYRGQQTDTSTFSPHSQILQAWFEAGIFGTAFFVCLGWKLVRALRWCIFLRGLDVFSVLLVSCLLRALWHLLFSPFAGLARLDVALAAVIVCLVEGEPRVPAPQVR